MKITKKKPVKETVKAKTKAIKQKVKAKVKGGAALVALALSLAGCLDPKQASRATSDEIGDVEPSVEICLKNSSSNTIIVTQTIKHGDGAIASADSSGSTETQTQTPTFDIKPDLDVRYNDAIAGASSTSRGIIDSLGSVLTDAGKASLLSMIESKSSGTVTLDKRDGGKVTVECKEGQCTTCTDCEIKQ